MKKIKRMLGAVLAAALFAAPVMQSHAENAKVAPRPSGYSGIFPNLDFYGVKTCRITASTTAVLCTASEGFVDAICANGGIGPAKYSLALDSGVAGTRSVTNSDDLIISPMVYANQDTASIPGGVYCWQPPYPVRFVNGLVGVQSAANHSTVIHYHLSTGANP